MKKVTMSSPIHILIPAYNVAPYIESSLHSIIKQDYNNIITIIIDDASTDDTPYLLKKITKENPNFRVFYGKKNRGIAARRDELILKSIDIDPYSFFIWLDADDIINDNKFVYKLMKQFVSTNANICLYGFDIKFENDSDTLKRNSIGLMKDAEKSKMILSHIMKAPGQVISMETHPEVSTFTSLGWTKAYSPSIKLIWPKSDINYMYEDFSYMSALFYADKITALPEHYTPITYLRRAQSLTGKRSPEHFYIDLIMQLLRFKKNVSDVAPEKMQFAHNFINEKLSQYEALLRSKIEFSEAGFSTNDLKLFKEAINKIYN